MKITHKENIMQMGCERCKRVGLWFGGVVGLFGWEEYFLIIAFILSQNLKKMLYCNKSYLQDFAVSPNVNKRK